MHLHPIRQKDDFVERMVSSPVAGSAKCLKGVTGLHAEVELGKVTDCLFVRF